MKIKGYQIKAAGKTADIYIYEDIGEGWFGGVSAKQFADDLTALGELDTINLFINSFGGSVFDGVAIYNQLKRHSAQVIVNVDGIAASIASIVVMAGDTIRMAANGFLMIHNPWTIAAGNAEDLHSVAETLEKIGGTLVNTYVDRSTADEDEITEMMAAETWFTAEEALALGLIDEITEELAIAASLDKAGLLAKFQNVPEPVKTIADEPEEDPAPEPKPEPKADGKEDFTPKPNPILTRMRVGARLYGK